VYLTTFNILFYFILEQELDALLMDVVQATNRGVAVTRNVSSEPNWSFGQASPSFSLELLSRLSV
jgi:hypothetical protein